MTVKIRTDELANVLKTVKRLTTREVLIGIPEANAERKPTPGETEEPPTNPELGYIHEFGEPANNIPARPFLIPGVESILPRATVMLKKAGERALSGEVVEIDKQLTAIGLVGQSAVQQKLVDGPFTPLKPRTLAARKERGNQGEKPLIDTGAMRQSVTFVVADKGK